MRTWTYSSLFADTCSWRSDDGRALVCVVPVVGGYQAEFYEDGQYIGSEPVSRTFRSAKSDARKWVRALSKPVKA